jgi:hypothetical protein
MGMIETPLYPDSTVSHGICTPCAQKYFKEPKKPVRGLLARLVTPLFHIVKS